MAMKTTPQSTAPVVPEVFAAWAVDSANATFLRRVFMHTFKRLADVRSLAGNEAPVESGLHTMPCRQGVAADIAGRVHHAVTVTRRHVKRDADVMVAAGTIKPPFEPDYGIRANSR